MKLDEGRKWSGRSGGVTAFLKWFVPAWLDGAKKFAIAITVAFFGGWLAAVLWLAWRTGWRIASQLSRWLP